MERRTLHALPETSIIEVSEPETAKLKTWPTSAKTTAGARVERPISRRQLINYLNYLNFQNISLFAVFKHSSSPRIQKFKAFPLPCQDAQLVCRWDQPMDIGLLTASYQLDCLHVPIGQRIFEVKPEVHQMDNHQMVVALPQQCRDIGERKLNRHQCSDIPVQLLQNAATYTGRLVDFNAYQFRVSVSTQEPQTFDWLDEEEPLTVVLGKGSKTVYSGECRILKQDNGQLRRDFILEPLKRHIRRFKSKEFRCSRLKLTPSPNVVFDHPLFPAAINLKIRDISGSGFSVEEKRLEAVLLPGMIIPDLELIFSNGSALRCMAQVIYSNPTEDAQADLVRSGLALLDIPVEDHFRLLTLLQQASDANAYMGGKVDLSALWEFFFETGFIYPQKYKFIEVNKEAIKATYQKLYNRNSDIASHFIYQEAGKILAHMAMVRFYPNAWLIHHHAAIRGSNNLAGLNVLNQVSRFINDCHRFNSMKLDYVFCYYQPENKFPSHVFGGAVRNINDLEICSVDNFAYYHHRTVTDVLPENWRLDPVYEEDLLHLKTVYEDISGGLMLRGLHLEAGRTDCTSLSSIYRSLQLKRERHLFSLRDRGRLCAIMMVNQADLGLNMSDLTNAVSIFVVDETHLTDKILIAATQSVARVYEQDEVPIMLFPQQVAARIGIASEKVYSLWVYYTHNLDYYFRYLKRYLKFVQH